MIECLLCYEHTRTHCTSTNIKYLLLPTDSRCASLFSLRVFAYTMLVCFSLSILLFIQLVLGLWARKDAGQSHFFWSTKWMNKSILLLPKGFNSQFQTSLTPLCKHKFICLYFDYFIIKLIHLQNVARFVNGRKQIYEPGVKSGHLAQKSHIEPQQQTNELKEKKNVCAATPVWRRDFI